MEGANNTEAHFFDIVADALNWKKWVYLTAVCDANNIKPDRDLFDFLAWRDPMLVNKGYKLRNTSLK